jgi:hypothetical protein
MPGGLHPPVEVVLSWKSNYANPVKHGHGLIVMECVLLGLCYIIVALRVYTRAYQAKYFGIDDALIVLNLVSRVLTHLCAHVDGSILRYL